MASGSEARRKLTALVVDDDATTRLCHQHMLTKLGVENEAARNGQEAVELIRSSGKSFDLVLMDRNMPVMDGIEATKKLRELGSQIRIIGVSAAAECEKEILQAGANGFVMKPLTSTVLEAIINSMSTGG